MGRCLWCKNPKRDKDCEEAKDVQEEDDRFEERQVLSANGVEEQREDYYRHGHESSLPGCWNVVRIGDMCHFKDDVAGTVGSSRDSGLPSESREPADLIVVY